MSCMEIQSIGKLSRTPTFISLVQHMSSGIGKSPGPSTKSEINAPWFYAHVSCCTDLGKTVRTLCCNWISIKKKKKTPKSLLMNYIISEGLWYDILYYSSNGSHNIFYWSTWKVFGNKCCLTFYFSSYSCWSRLRRLNSSTAGRSMRCLAGFDTQTEPSTQTNTNESFSPYLQL